MKKLLVTLFALAVVTGLKAQEWKDSVHIKQKVISAYKEESYIYFNTKKGWGIYDLLQKKMLVEPLYQFVQVTGNYLKPGIFFVQNNKAGFMQMDGQVIEKAQYARYGFLDAGESHQMNIKNSGLYFNDSAGNFSGRYPALFDVTEFSIAVSNGMVTVNHYLKGDRFPYQRILPDGNIIDSIDSRGNYVYAESLPQTSSGVFDLKTNTWLIEKGKTDKATDCKGNVLMLKKVLDSGSVVDQYRVMNVSDLTTTTFKNPPGGPLYSKLVKKALSGYHPRFVYSSDTSSTYCTYIFESDGKYGIYNPVFFKVDVEPEYDFVYVPDGSERAFTVRNGKVGLVEIITGKILYDNLYESLDIENLQYDEVPQKIIFCNGSAYEKDPSVEDNNSTLPVIAIEEARDRVHEHQGVAVDHGKMVVHEVEPSSIMEYSDNYDPDLTYLKAPGKCLSGVFDPVAMKWMVPQKFSRVVPGERGYACMNDCEDKKTYAFYSREGKLQFEKTPFDSIKNNVAAQQQLMQVPGSGKWKTMLIGPYDDRYIVNANGKWGIFNFGTLNWKVPPVHQYLAQNPLLKFYTVVDSGKVGLLTGNYRVMIPSLYNRIKFLPRENLVCANDTFLYLPDSVHLIGWADTTKNPDRYYADTLNGDYALDIELVKNKLYTEEEFFDDDMLFYDEYGSEFNKLIENSAANVADLSGGESVRFEKGWNVREWDHGFLTRDARDTIRTYDATGKHPVKLYTGTQAGCNGHLFWYREEDKRFAYDKKGMIVQPTNIEQLYFGHDYQPVGYSYHYFDGNKYMEIPKDFTVMCAANSGILLGYMVTRDSKGVFRKAYKYFDPTGKTFSNVELELTDSPMQVFPVKDGFVLFGQDLSTGLYNCLVLDNDLKTVKSAFKKLTAYKVPEAYRVINPIPYYELYTDKKIMYFDRHFQFLHECNYQDKPERILKLNRIILKSKFKTIVMDWKGHLIRQ